MDVLNFALWAWLGVEYHANTHSTTGRAPGLHFESELAYLRPVPGDISLRDVFLHRALRLLPAHPRPLWTHLRRPRRRLRPPRSHLSWLSDEPGLGVLVGDSGTGKTTSIRHLCAHLPRPRYRVLYHCDATLAPTGIYRALAGELGLKPHHRRSQIWQDIKRTMLHLVDEQNVQPVLVLDDPDADGLRIR